MTVPISRYPDIVRYAKDLADEHDLLLPCFGHAGDGNVHYAALVDPDDETAERRAEEVYDRIVEQAIEWGGTATGEHGIGMGKRTFLELEHGAGGVETMGRSRARSTPTTFSTPARCSPRPTPRGLASSCRSGDRPRSQRHPSGNTDGTAAPG